MGVELGDLLFEEVAELAGLGGEFGRNVADVKLGPVVAAAVIDGLHGDQVDETAEGIFLAERKLDDDGVAGEARADGLDGVVEVGAGLVHLVHEAEARDVVLVGLPPDGFGLGLDALLGVEDDDSAVEHAQAAFNLGGEIDVAGGVDQVDAAVAPVEGDGGGVDRDAALLLLDVEVGDGGAVVDVAHLVDRAAVVEHALGGGGLAGVDVRGDADIADFGQVFHG